MACVKWQPQSNLREFERFGRSAFNAVFFDCRIDVRGPYVTPELNSELQCISGKHVGKITLYLYALKTA